MRISYRNILFLISLIHITSIISISAKALSFVSNDLCAEYKIKPGPFALSYNKDLDLACPETFYFHANYLLMKPFQDGMDFALLDTNSIDGSLTPGEILGFSNAEKRNKWHSGMKVGLGFILNHNAWNIDAEWMWLHIKENRTYSTSGGNFFVPIIFGSQAQPNPNTNKTCSSKWKAEYNTINFKLASPYYVSQKFIASPNIGLKIAWIFQNLLFRYGGLFTSSEIDGLRINGFNDFFGIGSRAGFDSEFLLNSGWKIFGNFNTSLLYGKFKISEKDNLSSNNASHSEIVQRFYKIIPNMDINVGMACSKYFSNKEYLATLKIAYEFHYFWNLYQWGKFFDSNNPNSFDKLSNGDFSLGGLNFSLQFDL